MMWSYFLGAIPYDVFWGNSRGNIISIRRNIQNEETVDRPARSISTRYGLQ